MSINGITPQALKERLDAGEDLFVIDVRMPWEQEITRVDFSNDIVLDDLPERLADIPKDKTVVVMCRSGARSARACQFLESEGWDSDKLLNLEGGILRWAEDVDPSLPTTY